MRSRSPVSFCGEGEGRKFRYPLRAEASPAEVSECDACAADIEDEDEDWNEGVDVDFVAYTISNQMLMRITRDFTPVVSMPSDFQ